MTILASDANALELGERLLAGLDALAHFTDDPGRLTRLYLSDAHRDAASEVAGWMKEVGMTVRMDDIGNVIGRIDGGRPDLPALLIGSHIDTVRNAGRYDGALGVAVGILAVDLIKDEAANLPFAIEVIAFGDEEGVRFPTTLSGSRGIAGTLDITVLQSRDADGITVAEALAVFGLDPDQVHATAKQRSEVLAYVEVHIEQGPVLESMGAPLGVVTAINGASRIGVTVMGAAGHAGTTPMLGRRDALVAAAEMIMATEEIATEWGLVGTVGTVRVNGGAPNVIPGEVSFTIDLRAPRDDARMDALKALFIRFDAIAERRLVGVGTVTLYDAPAAACDQRLANAFDAAIKTVGLRPPWLSSGAGHDATAISDLCPIGMMFVRCEGGISHSPAENITAEDGGLAVLALAQFIRDFGSSGLAQAGSKGA